MNRQEFYKDKGLLYLIFMLQMFSFYLYIVFYKETQFFLVPISLFGMLGLFELWFIQEKAKVSGSDKTESEKKEDLKE